MLFINFKKNSSMICYCAALHKYRGTKVSRMQQSSHLAKDDELDIDVGEFISVEKKADDSWWFGRFSSNPLIPLSCAGKRECPSEKKRGWFPSNFVLELPREFDISKQGIVTDGCGVLILQMHPKWLVWVFGFQHFDVFTA